MLIMGTHRQPMQQRHRERAARWLAQRSQRNWSMLRRVRVLLSVPWGGLAILPAAYALMKATGERGMLDMEQARFNMIEQQIRPCEVLEGRILELLKHVRREHFVPKDMREMAFMDLEIPLGYGAYMWQPKLEARTVQELHLTRNDKVLEVGTGSGYLTALLSVLAGHVTSVEIVPELSAMAGQHLHSLPPRKRHPGDRRCGARLGRRRKL